jgi:chromosomal replication initiator protein
VRPRALTLLRLIGALHDRVAEYSERPFFPPNAPCRGERGTPVGIFSPPGAAQRKPLYTQNQALTRRITHVVTPELDHVWHQIQGALLETVGEQTYGLWLAPLRCVSLDGDTLVLEGPPEISAWASARLSGALASATASVLGPAVAVSIAGTASAPAPPERPAQASEPQLNPKYTFEQFVIGPSNRLSHAAALSVAEMPSQAYNPLFIYGPPGLGKTHLLHSVGNYVNTFGGGLTVRYATAEEFTNAFLHALGTRGLGDFKAHFRGVDVLLIDDVQFLERKARSEEELFHTFNALYDAGSQLVITCDRLPGDLGDLEDRLRERFAAGLVTDIERPDLATRVAILRKRAAHDGVSITDEALELLAARVASNVRALEGALIRLVAYGSLTARELDSDLAGDVLDRLGLALNVLHAPSIATVQDATCAHFGLTREELLSRSRSERVMWPRQAAMYLCKELTTHSLPTIARAFAGRDHTTVLYACKRVAAHIAASPPAYHDIEALTATLTQPS